jgi:cysteine desulfurase
VTYLDNAARAMPIDPPVDAAVTGPLPFFANPGGPHEAGRASREVLEAARQEILLDLMAARGRFYFYSCATEAANLGIQGFARSQQRAGMRRNRVVISAVEHPCVYATAHSLTRSGFEVQVVGVDAEGRVGADDLAARVVPSRTGLVAIMAVNNETGTLQDVEGLARCVKDLDPGAIFLCDAVQAVGKVPVTAASQIDMLFFSGRKLDAHTSIGGLWLGDEVAIDPVLFGGGQESGLRSGTEDSAATRMAAVLRARLRRRDADSHHVAELRSLLLGRLAAVGIQATPTVTPSVASPYIVSLALPARSAELVQFLSKRGVYVARGSACSSSWSKPSRILQAIGCLNPETVIRVSFAPENNGADVEKLVDGVLGFLGEAGTWAGG